MFRLFLIIYTLAGATLAGDATWRGTSIRAAVDLQRPEDDVTGKLLPRRARDTGRIDLDRDFGDFAFGTTVNAAGSRFDDAANLVRVGGYATVDLRVEYAFHSDWTVLARVTNLFDRDYQLANGFNAPGSTALLQLGWQAR